MPDDTVQIRRRIDTDPDFISLKRYGYSLEKFLERYPNGVPEDARGTKLIAQALCMSEEDVKNIVQKAIGAIRHNMKVKV